MAREAPSRKPTS